MSVKKKPIMEPYRGVAVGRTGNDGQRMKQKGQAHVTEDNAPASNLHLSG
jgi:hypothetical protein